ncbi:MAG: hypothetical protein K6F05_08375 [Succinivibrio sp.]|nr:hypothetical protein [Succinivibrio sp.]
MGDKAQTDGLQDVTQGVDLTEQELRDKIAELEAQKKALEEQIASHEVRSVKVLCLFTKTNIERMQTMTNYLNTSRNDLLNRLVEYAYLLGLYKKGLQIGIRHTQNGQQEEGQESETENVAKQDKDLELHEILSLGDFLQQHSTKKQMFFKDLYK